MNMHSPAPLDPSLSLYHLLDPAVLADPYPLYARLREAAPVAWDPYLACWVVTAYDDVLTVLKEFSADRTPDAAAMARLGLGEIGPLAEVMARQMLFLDAPAHTHLRKICSAAFTPRSIGPAPMITRPKCGPGSRKTPDCPTNTTTRSPAANGTT